MATDTTPKAGEEAIRELLPPATYRLSWGIAVLLLLANSGFVAGGLYLTFFKEAADFKDWSIGLLCIAFLGMTLLTFVGDLSIRGPLLIVDGKGVWDKRMSPRPIPWHAIRSAWIEKVRYTKFICLELDDPEPYLPPLLSFRGFFARLNPIMRYTQMTITTLPLAGRAEEILATIERYRAQASGESSSRR